MIKNKKIDADKLAKEIFTGTQVGVLLEDIDDKLALIAENYGSVVDRLDKVDERLENLKKGQETLIIRMDRMETKLDATFEAVGDIKTELTVIKEKDDELDTRVTVLEKQVAV